MEILHFCPSRSFSGLEQYALAMAVDQKNRGYEVGFVVCPGSRLQEECMRNEIPTIVFNPFMRFASFRFWPLFHEFLAKMTSLKVIHLHSTQELFHVFGGLILYKIKRRRLAGARKPKVILQTHLWVSHRKKNPYHMMLYSVVDEIWCSSEAAKKALLSVLPVSKKKMRIIKYGRPVEVIQSEILDKQEAREKLCLPKSATIFGTVSRIEKSKGVRELCEAFAKLASENKEIHLAIIGGPSPMNKEAEKYWMMIELWFKKQDKQIQKRIHFLGSIEKSHQYLKAFDVYVLPSYLETFSLALLDAQLAGLPTVATSSGGTPDVVVNSKTGWLVKPKNTKSLYEGLNSLLSTRIEVNLHFS
jgi:glycosyltransferase involved in cell wall biosynthesis